MLKTPPGVSKRRNVSHPLDEAGAIFETLYKKYLSLDADNLQKQAENYLLKSFYNKSSVKNNLNTQSSGFSEPRNLNTTQSSESECVANTNNNFVKKTSFNLDDYSKEEYRDKDKNIEYEDLRKFEEDVKDSNENLKFLKKESIYLREKIQDSPQNLNHHQTKNLQNNINNNFETPKEENTLKERVRFEDQLENTKPNPLRDNSTRSSYRNLTKRFKKPLKQSNKEDTKVFVDNFSDISEDSVDKGKDTLKGLLTVQEYCDGDFDKVDEYLSPTNLRRKKFENRNSLLVKNKELNFTCTVCLLFQVLLTLILFGLFLLFYSFPYEKNYWFVTVLFPFLVHFGTFYLIFTFTDYTIKKRFLVYTNDYTVEVLNKRLNRELCYKRLNKYSTWGERVLVLFGLVIACVPATFTSDFKSFGNKEYLYLGLIVGYLALHLAFTFYYFIVKFKRLLIYTSDEDY